MPVIVIDTLIKFLQIIQLMIFARVIISWLPIPRNNPIIVILYQLTEPILSPIRTLIQKSSFGSGMFDFSAIIAILLISFILRLLQ